MRIALAGQVLDNSGYGEYARLVAWAIHEAGHNLRVRNRPHAPLSPERFGHKGALICARLGHEVDEPVDLALSVYVPTSFHFLSLDDTVNVGLGMHESDLVPPDYTRVANSSVDVLAVPSMWNQWTFLASGLKIPSTVIHPPVDSDLRRMHVRDRDGITTFLSIFAWSGPHKNPKALVQAFCRAFSCSDPVKLVIKTGGASDEEIRDDVHEAMRLSSVARSPRIEILCGSMTRSDILDLYASSDVYVSSHRGEGWGLPIFESMAIGMPTIATAFSAPLEFMNPLNSYLVGYDYDQEAGNANVDIDDLARKMRRAFERPDESRALGEHARLELGRRFTVEHTMAQVIESARLAEEARTASAAPAGNTMEVGDPVEGSPTQPLGELTDRLG